MALSFSSVNSLSSLCWTLIAPSNNHHFSKLLIKHDRTSGHCMKNLGDGGEQVGCIRCRCYYLYLSSSKQGSWKGKEQHRIFLGVSSLLSIYTSWCLKQTREGHKKDSTHRWDLFQVISGSPLSLWLVLYCTLYWCIQCFQKCTQILRVYGCVHHSELCFFMSMACKGFEWFRKIANTCYTTCPFGDNSTPSLANALCKKKKKRKKADPATTCINLIRSALSHSANTLCFLSKIKRHAMGEKKMAFYESGEAAFTLHLQSMRVCGWSWL